MGLFDQLKSKAKTAVGSAVSNLGKKSETFTFAALPDRITNAELPAWAASVERTGNILY